MEVILRRKKQTSSWTEVRRKEVNWTTTELQAKTEAKKYDDEIDESRFELKDRHKGTMARDTS